MNTSKSIPLLAVLFLTANFSGASAATKVARQTSPSALVAELYRESARKRSPFFQTRSRALVNKYFEKRLGDLIWKDAIRSKREVGAIDGDPLFNAQDMEIKHFMIHGPDFASGRARMVDGRKAPVTGAEVKVTFENFGKKQQIMFLLTPGAVTSGWKIANIKYDDGTDLLGILKGGNQRQPNSMISTPSS